LPANDFVDTISAPICHAAQIPAAADVILGQPVGAYPAWLAKFLELLR